MNILFISNLTGNLFAGPNNSVPAQITAQSKIDNVFWYNINHNRRTEWVDLHCYTLDDFPTGRLSDLPEPFNHPDIVVVEEFYCYPFSKIIYDIQKASIPYIIIPRSELTQKAQKKNRFKKIIGNILYFKAFAKKAAAIMYLSEKERRHYQRHDLRKRKREPHPGDPEDSRQQKRRGNKNYELAHDRGDQRVDTLGESLKD